MPLNEQIANKIREALIDVKNLTEKTMFGGIVFMVNDKMCVGVDKNALMLRCEPEMTEELLSKKGARQFDLTGKPMRGWLLIDEEGTKNKRDFDYWINLALDFNKKAKSSRRPKKRPSH